MFVAGVYRKPTKKRKATYVVRKEEATALKRQLETLQRQVAALKTVTEQVAMEPNEHLRQLLGVNRVLNETLRSQQLVVAGAQSTMAEFQENQSSNPLFTDVHLPQSWDQRRQLLLRLKDDMFAHGCRYVLERSRHLDLLKKHSSEQRFEDDQGGFCCERFELHHLVGVQSVKQVYDAATFFLTNAEISLSEATGLVIVREDYDNVGGDDSVCNYRLISSYPSGLIAESNRISYTKYFEHHELIGGPCALMVVKNVDSDGLFPYNSRERVRKDISAVLLIREIERKKQRKVIEERASSKLGNCQGVDKEEAVVVIQRLTFMKAHQPDFDLPTHVLHDFGDDVARWGQVMAQTIREVISTAHVQRGDSCPQPPETRIRAATEDLGHRPALLVEMRDNAMPEASQRCIRSKQDAHFSLSSQENQSSNPLFSDIHLPQTWDQRRQLLLRLKDDMFTHGCRYVLERSRHLDLLKKHSSEQRFEDGQGAFCCERFELCHFVGVQSAKQVYDAATFFLTNAEISMSEATGLVIVREDYDSVDDDNPVCNSRLICEYPDGLVVESSRISFSQYVEHSDLFGGGPCAMFVADSVVSDALYPYSSSDRVRNDVSAMFVITEMRRKKQKDAETLTDVRDRQGVCKAAGEAEEEVVVVMRRAVFTKIHQPEFEIPMHTLHALGDDAARWGKVMVQTVREVMEAA
ncbi:hypothetical protein BBJ28_00003212 [Nothophytophthora sp. Chile5]|nr:hypothetical protein BBJ28_00003212 [Nothophytophthora sp. Chile5]